MFRAAPGRDPLAAARAVLNDCLLTICVVVALGCALALLMT